MRSSRAIGVLVGLLMLSLALPAAARSPEEQVERGLSEFQDLEFSSAIASLELVVRSNDSSPSQKLLALELIAISHLSLGHTRRAKAAFTKLVAMRPDYELRNHDDSPKVIAVFEAVRAQYRKSLPASARYEEPARHEEPVSEPEEDAKLSLSWGGEIDARSGRRLSISVLATGNAPTSMTLFWSAGDEDYRRARMRLGKDRLWRVRIRLPKRRDDYELAYFVEAEGPAGELVGDLENEDRPRSTWVTGRGRPANERNLTKNAWYGNWKVWAGVGAVALLGGTTAILSSGSDQSSGSLPPGRITLSP